MEPAPKPIETTATATAGAPMAGTTTSAAPHTSSPAAGSTPRRIRELAPRLSSRSLRNVLRNIAMRAAMDGIPNIVPACNRLYPRPTSKYDGNQVSTAETSAYIANTATRPPRNVRVRKIVVQATVFCGCWAAPCTLAGRDSGRSPYGPSFQTTSHNPHHATPTIARAMNPARQPMVATINASTGATAILATDAPEVSHALGK